MSNTIRQAFDPCEMRVVGTFRLARAIHDEIGKFRNVRDVCAYLLELLPLLLDADAMTIELPAAISPKPFRAPEGGFVEFPLNDTDHPQDQVLEISTQLRTDDGAIGRICLYYSHASAEAGPQGVALLEFVGSCLSRVIDDTLRGNARLASLTATERKVLFLFVHATAEILDRLQISYETFRVHRKRIYKKLGVHNRQDALKVAHLAGFLDVAELDAVAPS